MSFDELMKATWQLSCQEVSLTHARLTSFIGTRTGSLWLSKIKRKSLKILSVRIVVLTVKQA
jgi:hypothetical protein